MDKKPFNPVKVFGLSLLALIVVGGMWYVSVKNSFITMETSVDASWAQVENQLQRRYDLIPNLVNTVKGYAKHEDKVFSNVAEARAKLAGARTTDDKVRASRGLDSAISRLLVISENYPNLKADTQFIRLMDELAGAENRIAVERKRYNDNVELYNATIRQVPKNYVASFSGFKPKEFFKAESSATEAPKVDFSN
ncbi:MAG: LemA family protein [Candidatus Margulisiibacteriota bacterium]